MFLRLLSFPFFLLICSPVRRMTRVELLRTGVMKAVFFSSRKIMIKIIHMHSYIHTFIAAVTFRYPYSYRDTPLLKGACY